MAAPSILIKIAGNTRPVGGEDLEGGAGRHAFSSCRRAIVNLISGTNWEANELHSYVFFDNIAQNRLQEIVTLRHPFQAITHKNIQNGMQSEERDTMGRPCPVAEGWRRNQSKRASFE